MAKTGKTLRHASALKANRQAKARQIQNYKVRSQVRTLTNQFTKLISEKKADAAKAHFIVVQSAWQRAAKKGIFSKNSASRKISIFASQLASLKK